MGSSMSTHAHEITSFQENKEVTLVVSGRKTEDLVLVEPHMISTDDEVSDDDSAVDSDEESEDSDDEDDEDEEWNERLQILTDARNLAKVADFFLSPHKPVATDATSCARCYFTRPSAPEQTSPEDEEEAARIREDSLAMKKLAVDYTHPEKPVESSPEIFGRNYFTRPSAEPTVDLDEAEERARILEDVQQMKKLAIDYLCPQFPVVTTDSCATGRNYFTRPSAEDVDTEERDLILEEMKLMKQLAVDYLHPEKPVVTSDPTAFGRNYFARPSADEYEGEDDMDERDDILEDMKQLNSLAQDYLQPERPLQVDTLASCRNYFSRPSAEAPESAEEAEERAQVLADAQALKQLAVDYLHPENPVVTSDPFATGRNYFDRPSAEDFDDEAEERDLILEEMKQLKQLAVDYLHPENPVITLDPCATGRNYFGRPSADEYETEEKAMILEEMKRMKQLAVDYLHPEKPVVTSDPIATGRNYFGRASSPDQVSLEMAIEERQILLEMAQLKQLSEDYFYPERPVKSAGAARNYFGRPSALGHDDHIHSQGHAIYEPVENYHHHQESHDHVFVDHVLGLVQHEHHPHEDDHSFQSEHFDMDEDAIQTFRENLHSTEFFKGQHPIKEAVGIDGEDGNLSRSPSCVMLFGLEDM